MLCTRRPDTGIPSRVADRRQLARRPRGTIYRGCEMLERFPRTKERLRIASDDLEGKVRSFSFSLPAPSNLARGVANFRLNGHLLYVCDRLHDGREPAKTGDHQLDLGPQPVHYHVQLVHLVVRPHQKVIT